MNLLRTVLEVHTQIINASKAPKTCLLFVIRDYVGKTPRENLAKILKDDLCRIWDSIQKLLHIHSDNSIYDFFDLQFAFLPHKLLQPLEFSEAVEFLRERFSSASCEAIFPLVTPQERVSASDFSVFADSIWTHIESNKDLDLPSERELLAQYRCDELIESILFEFEKFIESDRQELLRERVVRNLGLKMIQKLTEFKDKFRQDSLRYSPKVVERKLDELNSRLLALCGELARVQVELYRKIALDGFDEKLFSRDSGDFTKALDEALCKATTMFEQLIQGMLPLSILLFYGHIIFTSYRTLPETSGIGRDGGV